MFCHLKICILNKSQAIFSSDCRLQCYDWWKNFFDQPVKNKITYSNIKKITTSQGDDYTTGYLLDYPYLKEHYRMIKIDLSKQQALDANPKAIQQINFTRNLNRDGNTSMFFIFEEAKKPVLDFSQGTVRVL